MWRMIIGGVFVLYFLLVVGAYPTRPESEGSSFIAVFNTHLFLFGLPGGLLFLFGLRANRNIMKGAIFFGSMVLLPFIVFGHIIILVEYGLIPATILFLTVFFIYYKILSGKRKDDNINVSSDTNKVEQTGKKIDIDLNTKQTPTVVGSTKLKAQGDSRELLSRNNVDVSANTPDSFDGVGVSERAGKNLLKNTKYDNLAENKYITNLDYVEGDMHPGLKSGTLQGRCSDDDCPCPHPGTFIPKGDGYLYISDEIVQFRKMYPKLCDAKKAMQQILLEKNKDILSMSPDGEHTIIMPELGGILVCGQGAKKRNLDLEVAAKDAKHWWEYNQIPLRPTPTVDKSVEHRNKEIRTDNKEIQNMEKENTISTYNAEAALHDAASKGNTENVSVLLENGVNVNARNSGQTPLHSATICGHDAVANILLSKGADVNAKADDGETALHYAAKAGHNNLVNTLLNHGADVNASRDGVTALHYASIIKFTSSASRSEIINNLLKCGADPTIKDVEGRTALNTAERFGDPVVAEMIRNYRPNNVEA